MLYVFRKTFRRLEFVSVLAKKLSEDGDRAQYTKRCFKGEIGQWIMSKKVINFTEYFYQVCRYYFPIVTCVSVTSRTVY
jgi:hypothetical protein